ncbi:transcriptional regulator GlxA family with amidase domain [Luteibacter jiangsuensis]|uniref:Transcriptional regulator GlxA family with amidase domain n=1 Tax=Luteibacter jiangsuensis TaxID=637577 RepID=A0ABT9SXA0_9GAMM|nr:helix-turn-helix domain-containing protein [Luteibacter jiangsuensis]MDQ0008577.1 transcriptional regulator GlxA family with amidase domain [Luteibacter jiangsuensis]
MPRPSPRQIPVYVVVPPRVLLLDVAGPIEVLRRANLEQETVRFDVTYVGTMRTVGSSVGLDVTGIGALPARITEGAIVVVPGAADVPLGVGRTTAAQDDASEASIVAWLRKVVRPGMRVVSICSGALLVARAGLLDGYECTTHHGCTAQLTRAAPAARVRENRLYVEDGERLTSAGITAGVDLMLHLVASLVGPSVALAVARFLVVYLRRAGGDPQLSPWLEGRNHMHAAVHRAQDAVAADPARDWSVASLARVAASSPRNLSRLFNEHTGMSVTDFVNRMRVALARELLTGSRLDVETVAERSGFGSSRQLRRAWARVNDLPPSRMREVEV